MARKRKKKGRSAAGKMDELTRLHLAHLRRVFSNAKKDLRKKTATPAQHERALKEAREARNAINRIQARHGAKKGRKGKR